MFNPHFINNEMNFISGWYIDKDLCQKICEVIERKKICLKADESGFRNYLAINLHKLDRGLFESYLETLEKLKRLYYKQYTSLEIGISDTKFVSSVFKNDKVETPIIQVQKYKPGNYYSALHCEATDKKTASRAVAFMTYLNSIDQGGGTNFPYQKFTANAEQGLTLLWPPYWTHPHVGVPAYKENKYIITGWFDFLV